MNSDEHNHGKKYNMKYPPRNPRRAVNNATTWNLLVWESSLPRNCKLVACYLRTHMNDYQEIAFPSIGRIAAYCCLSENPVRDALKTLCESGYLVAVGRNQTYGTNIYQIATPLQNLNPPSDSEPLQILSPTPSDSEPELTNKLTNTLSKGRKKFVKPTLEEVREYCLTKKYDIDPETFIAWNESKGWRVGNAPMVCWKSALTTWSKRRRGGEGTQRFINEHQDSRRLSGAERTRIAREQARQRELAQQSSGMGCVESD